MSWSSAAMRSWNEAHWYYRRAAAIETQRADLAARVAAAVKQLAVMEADRDEAQQEGDSHHDLVATWCTTHRVSLPPVPDEVPLAETTQWPAVPPATPAQPQGESFTVGPMTPAAAALWGHVATGATVHVHWVGGGGITGLVKERHGDQLVIGLEEAHYLVDASSGDVASVEAAQPGDVTEVLPVIPAEQVEHAECRECHTPIGRLSGGTSYHLHSGLIACNPDAIVSTEAAPLDPAEQPEGGPR